MPLICDRILPQVIKLWNQVTTIQYKLEGLIEKPVGFKLFLLGFLIFHHGYEVPKEELSSVVVGRSNCNGVTPVTHRALAKPVSRLFFPDELG